MVLALPNQMDPNGTAWQPTRRQQVLIDRLSRPPYVPMAEAARELGLSPSTAKKWNMHPDFRRALRQAYATSQAELKEELERSIRALADQAIDALTKAMAGGDAGAAVRAALAVIERVLGKPVQRHVLELTQEVEAFEQIVLDAVAEVSVDVRVAIEQKIREKVTGPGARDLPQARTDRTAFA